MKFNLKKDFNKALNAYPLLKLESSDDGRSFRLKGEIEIFESNSNTFIDIFSAELYFPKNYPNCFPKVFEVGGKIPRKLERHVMPKDGNLCLAVEIEEILLCKHGISTLWFIEKVLVPRLSEEYRVNKGGKYQREYSHDFGAVWEFLMKKFKTSEQKQILYFLNSIINNELPKMKDLCICGSRKQYKKCHRDDFISIQHLGKEFLSEILKKLKQKPYTDINL